MSAFKFFDRVYCVHLPNPQRRVAMETQFTRLGIEAQYLHAAQPPGQFSIWNMRRNARGEFGANLSHVKCLSHALAEGARQPLFIEDDVVFRADAEQLLAESLSGLPADWDVFYLGGHPRGPADRVSSRLVRVGAFSFAEAYAVSARALPGLLDLWFDRISRPRAMFDFILGEFAASHHAYCAYPLLCEQPPGLSQISGDQEDKRRLVARGWVNNLDAKYVTVEHLAASTR